MRNGTPEEREREHVYQQEKKNGGAVTDIMERRRWRLAGPLKGIGSGTSKVTWQALIGQPIS